MNDVKEGFICPICLNDLARPDFLQAHFEKEHSDLDSVPTYSLKSFLNKAKNKILGSSFFDETIDVVEDNEKSINRLSEKCDEGVIRSRTAFFRRVRQGRVDFRAMRTKQLFTRLEKLFSIQEDSKRRRILEKHITPWADDRDIKRCPDCCRSFRLMCRKHHCRLCGYIICNSCSLFISEKMARKMIDQNNSSATHFSRHETHSTMTFRLRNADSMTSIDSAPVVEGERCIRICCDCKNLLQTRYDLLQLKSVEPVIVTLYKQISFVIDKFKSVEPELSAAIQAVLKSGSGNVTDLKKRHADAQLYIDGLHKAIGQIDNYISACSMSLSSKELTIIKNLRVYVVSFLQGHAKKLPEIPDETELKRIRNEHRRQEYERKSAPPQMNGFVNTTEDKKSLPERVDDDPLYQQIETVKKYIRDARRACRYDEVMILEDNLRELQLQTANCKGPSPTSVLS